MSRFLTLYRDCRKDDCSKYGFHEIREISWNFNEQGLCDWARDNYKFHYGKEPQLTFYEVTSYHDGKYDSIYTRRQFNETIQHYWDALKWKLRSGECYFYPQHSSMERVADSDGKPIMLNPGERYTVTVFDDKFHMNENDIQFYVQWFMELVSFAKQYLNDKSHILAVSDENRICRRSRSIHRQIETHADYLLKNLKKKKRQV